MKGRCLCHSGWKGAECDVPTNQCIDVACSSHGTCITGTCICNPGYKGESCEEGKVPTQATSEVEAIVHYGMAFMGSCSEVRYTSESWPTVLHKVRLPSSGARCEG